MTSAIDAEASEEFAIQPERTGETDIAGRDENAIDMPHAVRRIANKPLCKSFSSGKQLMGMIMATGEKHRGAADWGSDFFGTLNDMPPEPVAGIGHVLEAMATFPAYADARQWLLRNLGISKGSSVIEAGCGTGAALPDIVSMVGNQARIAGNDPTKAFVASARARAEKLGASNAQYEIGDIRSMAADNGAFDAAFCDKVLIHAGPAQAAVSEMARVVRCGGRVGALEWLPWFAISSSRPEFLDAFNAVFRKACFDYFVSLNLARHFHSARLKDVRTQAFLAHTDNLESHPFWRAFIVQQMPMFIHAELIDPPTAQAFIADLEGLNAKGEFSASFIVHAAVGTK